MRLVLFAAESTVSRAVDFFSGRDGYSHCALELVPGLILDATLDGGVQTRPLADYDGRPRAYVELEAEPEPGYVWRRARPLIGRPFDVAALGGTNGGRLNCTSLVLHVLPRSVLERVVGVCQSPGRCAPISPNDIAAAFGLAPAQLYATALH